MSDPRPVIAHVVHQMQLAGAEVLAAALANQLAQSYRFVFLCLDQVGPMGEQLTEQGHVVVDLQRQPGIDRDLVKRMRQTLHAHRVDLIHAHQYTPFFYASLGRGLRRRPSILFTEHGRHYPDVRKVKRIVANRLLLSRRDRVTAVGQFVKQALVSNEGMADHRIEVVYNGIDPDRFILAHDAEVRRRTRQALGLTDQSLAVLQVARFHAVKDHATSIRAMAHLVTKIPQAVLLLVGDGDLRAQCEQLTEQLGLVDHVRFLGVRQDIAQLMAGADLFVLSSLSEGISVTLLEAMASRLAICATDVGGNGEVVAHQETGLLSPRGDAQALANNAMTLLQDRPKRESMGRQGLVRLQRQFTQARMHQRFAQIYQQMT